MKRRRNHAAWIAGGMALVEASDGTTNALGLSRPDLFAQLYGPGSAARFRAHAASLGAAAVAVDLANLRTDVDTVDQLELLRDRVGAHTRAAISAVPL